jgi:hypothetical protein
MCLLVVYPSLFSANCPGACMEIRRRRMQTDTNDWPQHQSRRPTSHCILTAGSRSAATPHRECGIVAVDPQQPPQRDGSPRFRLHGSFVVTIHVPSSRLHPPSSSAAVRNAVRSAFAFAGAQWTATSCPWPDRRLRPPFHVQLRLLSLVDSIAVIQKKKMCVRSRARRTVSSSLCCRAASVCRSAFFPLVRSSMKCPHCLGKPAVPTAACSLQHR